MTSRRALLLGALALAACRGAPRGDRCARCGMLIPRGSHWAAGAVRADGRRLAFDAPSCLFHTVLRDPSLRGARLWVTPYYAAAGVRADARALRYAVGSDVRGPMGADLIPLRENEIDTFTRDHRPRRALRFDEVTAAALDAL